MSDPFTDEDLNLDWEEEPPEPIKDDAEFPGGTFVKVERYEGSAWVVRHVLGDRVICRPIGDDRDWNFDREELTKIDREAFCGMCGPIGCEHDGLDREWLNETGP